ncbi:MAG: aldo/keto reductase [Candidatus Thermoplasmatota archaeon]|nr:aldo/keto reductase [Candidatus Thermoplasmatota archaeon]
MDGLPTLTLGPDGEEIPRLGLGTWQMEHDDPQACIRALRRGVDLGARLVDTAELYGRGEVERLVGEALDGLRAEVFLVTKVLPSNASREGTVQAMEASLERLATDHVDLYLLHWTSRHPIEETMAAFRELVEEGLTRYVGVSNLSLQAFHEAQAALGEDIPLVTDQVLYWLGARNVENDLLPGLAEAGRTLMAYSPFGSGALPGPGTPGGDALNEVAQRHEASPHQVALAWVLRHEHVFAIPKTSSVAHLEENLRAAELTLTDEDLSRLDKGFPRGTGSRIQTL